MSKRLTLNTLALIGGVLLTQVALAAITLIAPLNSGEWSSTFSNIITSPAYDETPANQYTCNGRSHTHYYTLQSIDTPTLEHWTAVHAFAMVLDNNTGQNWIPDNGTANPTTNDFLSNVDTQNMTCSLGSATTAMVPCGFSTKNGLNQVIASGWHNDPDDGTPIQTTVTYERLNFLPGNPRGLVWRYSANAPGDLRRVEWLKGYNPSLPLDTTWADGDPTNMPNPSINESISFNLTGFEEQFSATTYSYTLVEHMHIHPNANKSNLNNWSHYYTINADPNQDGISTADPDGDYVYWHGINAVNRSIFDDCEAVDPVCTDLYLDPPLEIPAESADGVYEVSITVEDELGDPYDGEYTYTSDGTCEFHSSQLAAILGFGSPSMTTQQESVWVHSCSEGDTISIQENEFPAACSDSYTIPVGTYCGDGEIQDPNDDGESEQCDDGNNQDGDGCSSTCQNETTLFCEELSIGSPRSITAENAGNVYRVSIDATDQLDGQWGGPFTYRSSRQTEGTSTCMFSATEFDANQNSGFTTLTTTATQVWVFGCSPGDMIIAHDLNDERSCYDSLSIPLVTGDDDDDDDDDDSCTGLSFDPDWINQRNLGRTIFTITPNGAWTGQWNWYAETSPGDPIGFFYIPDGDPNTEDDLDDNIITDAMSVGYNNPGRGAGDRIVVVNTDDPECRGSIRVRANSGNINGGGGNGNRCGDGRIKSPNDNGIYETCDDGNQINGDGCSNMCELEDFCAGIEIISPDPSTLDFNNMADTGTLQVRAYDHNGDTWTHPNGDTFTWAKLQGGTVIFDDQQHQPWSVVSTNQDTVSYEKTGLGNSQFEVRNNDFYPTCSIPFETQGSDDTLTKHVNTYNFGWFNADPGSYNSNSINGNCFGATGNNCGSSTYGHDFDYVFYNIDYKPNNHQIDVNITDSIADGGLSPENTDPAQSWNGNVQFYRLGTNQASPGNDPQEVENWIHFRKDLNMDIVFHKPGDTHGYEIPSCTYYEDPVTGERSTEPEQDETCFEGTIENSNGITLKQLDQRPNGYRENDATIRIRYIGVVDNGNFDCNNIRENVTCPVQAFENTAYVDGNRIQDTAALTIVCPFLLTRNAGDVYVEGTLNSYDLSCYYDDFRNTDGLVIQNNAHTGLGERFSSYVSSLMTDLETVWQQTAITERIRRQTNAISRYQNEQSLLSQLGVFSRDDDTIELDGFDRLQDEQFRSQMTNPHQNVYRLTNKNLEISQPLIIEEGAHTFIIDGGNLNINADISYRDIPFNELRNPNDLPSVAFIVLNGGNVDISDNVELISGVYYVDGGHFTGAWTDPFTQLEVHGSIYGNLDRLLEQRTFAGPANYDHGNVVIRYDERIMLNTPPGLEEYVDIDSQRVAR